MEEEKNKGGGGESACVPHMLQNNQKINTTLQRVPALESKDIRIRTWRKRCPLVRWLCFASPSVGRFVNDKKMMHEGWL